MTAFAPVIDALWIAVVGLPFVTAAILAFIGSWRIGTLVNAGSATVLTALSCALPLTLPDGLIVLTAVIAMTTSWYGRRDIPAAMAEHSLDRRQTRVYHATFQVFVGAVVLALLAGQPMLTWLALTLAMAAAAVIVGVAGRHAAASRLALLCGVGLMLALLGILLLNVAPTPATLLIVLGYGGVAGLVPLHAWQADAAAEGPAPGAILVSTLLVNAPLLAFMRLSDPVAPGVLIALGLASLLSGGALLFGRPDPRRAVAYAGMAQLGMIEAAIGLGDAGAPRLIAMLALARAAVLQCEADMPTQYASMLALALLPLFALSQLAEPAVGVSAWLLVPLGGGALLTSGGLLRYVPAGPGTVLHSLMQAPVWLQLALVVLLAFWVPIG
jgi:hydrogenase-4 component F